MSIPQFVIFVGPPYSGKTMYYLQHYATTHERVSASDLLRKDASVGLRGVVRTLADILKQGKNVVLDDENWSRETRVSYLKGVQKKFFLSKSNPQQVVIDVVASAHSGNCCCSITHIWFLHLERHSKMESGQKTF
ncbi:uncharacterized protein LOC134195479 isoform X1 [Corticium candelabrum]|uniref:uncharacterized protein LOC134195479 isoform X1 n=2 Tax=Corticium candelabrum TaxID=121492 RepID=UPI002E25C827|nr:uncharacterized protein LOC134195479 isoform X1 [Corticium candelabrum]